MKIILLIILLFRGASQSNHKPRNKPKIIAVILRSAKDEVHDNFADVKNYDDLLERVTPSTTEPPEFLDNFFFETVRPTRTKAFKHFTIPKELSRPQELIYKTNYHVTLETVTQRNTRMIVHNPYIVKTYDSARFLEHVFSNGMWNHLHNDLNMSYVTDPMRTQTSNWFFTTHTTTTTVPTPYQLNFYKNPLKEEPPIKPFDFVWGDEMATLK